MHEPETFSIAAKYLKEIVEKNVNALVLGCTHYPILRDVIQETVGADVILIDSGEATAEEVKQLLANKNLTNKNPLKREITRRLCDDLDHFYVTDAADRFSRVAERFLGVKPAKLEAIEVFGKDELVNHK
jgi:glutamate racemase